MTIEDAPLAAVASLAAFVLLSLYDGVVVHFFIERLPTREAARIEHRLHTARALAFPAILATFFAGRGPALLGFGLLAMDQALEVWDMAVERRSRAHSAGLRSSEYVVHGLLTTLRATAVTFTVMIDRERMNTDLLDAFVRLLLPGAIIIALAHVVLAVPAGRALLARRGEAGGR